MKILRTLLFTSLFTSLSLSSLSVSAFAGGGFLPIGWVDADISNKLINQGSADLSSNGEIRFSADDRAMGYRQIKSQSFDLKLGVYGGWYLNNGSFLDSWFGVGAAIIPVDGSTTVSDRFVQSIDEASSLSDLQIPAHAPALDSWKKNDSIYYSNRGGVIFSVGAGYAFTGLSGDYFAEGEWGTYIEKLDGKKVYVKITNLSLEDFDLMVGNYAASVLLSTFNKTDSMFSYIFDLADPRAAIAYENMIHGSVKEAEALAAVSSSALLDLSEKGETAGDQTRFFLGIPFLNISNTSGSLYNFSDTVYHLDGSKSDVEYGLAWSESDSNVFSHHKSVSQSFYGVSYRNTKADVLTEQGKYGRLILSYENDQSDSGTLSDALSDMTVRTGLRRQLKLSGGQPDGDLGYTHLTLTVDIAETTTRALMAMNARNEITGSSSDEFITSYFETLGDPDKLCTDPQAPNAETCRDDYRSGTQDAINDLKSALGEMSVAERNHDDKEFVKAYAKFGEALLTNEFVFSTVIQLTPSGPMNVTFTAEGERISKIHQNLTVNASTQQALLLR